MQNQEPLDSNLSKGNPDLNQNVVRMNMDEAAAEVRKSAYWFYWIAGLSLLNSLIGSSGRQFIIGLALTQVFDGVIAELGIDGVLAIIFSLIIPLIFVVFGICAGRLQRWAFVAGGIVYLLDALLYIYVALQGEGGFFAIAVHGYILYKLWIGLKQITAYDKETENLVE